MPFDAMGYVCKATFVAYALLASFNTITRKDSDAVRFVLGLLSSYDIATQKLLMTHDACALARVHLPRLKTMAARHSYTHKGLLKNDSQAHQLLSVIITPLVQHLDPEQYQDIVDSIQDANALLSMPISTLNELVTSWRVQNLELVQNWRSFPILGINSYFFGCSILPGYRIEDVLTHLPYPVLPGSRASSIDEMSNIYCTLADKPEGSESGSSAIPSLFYATLPRLNPPVRQTMLLAHSNGSSIHSLAHVEEGWRGELLVGTGIELKEDSCSGNQALNFLHGREHPSEREHKAMLPSRRKIVRCIRLGFQALLTSL